MTWTTDKPTQPGYYWMKNLVLDDGAVIVGEVAGVYQVGRYLHTTLRQELWVSCYLHPNLKHIRSGQWAGPLEPPS